MIRKIAASTIGTLFMAATWLIPLPSAQSVVYGEVITNASKTVPWVVSIWYAPSQSEVYKASPICTGSLISSTTVLTAAHCNIQTGLYFVGVGADTVDDATDVGQLIPVSGTQSHSRYNARTFLNDVAVFVLSRPVIDIQPINLPTKSQAKSIKKIKNFVIYGWGSNQNGESADFLRTAKLKNYTSRGSKYYGSIFNSNTMLAASRYIPKEKIWAGGCNGDSGGPLVANINGRQTLVGITSFGTKGCDNSRPTVFSNVSYYVNELPKLVAVASASSVAANRSLPENITPPTIVGIPKVNETITCNPGTWTSNTTSLTYRWSGSFRISSIATPTIKITDADVGQTFTCQVTGVNRNGRIQRDAQVTILTPPSLVGFPTITGYTNSSSLSENNPLSCTPPSGSNFNSLEVAWWISSVPFASSNAVLLSKGQSMNLTGNVVKANLGKGLYCVVTALGAGGETSKATYIQLSAGSAPYGLSVSINRNSIPTNFSIVDFDAQCSSYSKNVVYAWYVSNQFYFTSGPYGTLIGNGPVLKLTADILTKVAGKNLVCVGTESNLWGSTTDYESYSVNSNVLEYVSGPKTITKNWSVSVGGNVHGTDANVRFLVDARNSYGTVDYDWVSISSFTFQVSRKNIATGVSEFVGTKTFDSSPPTWYMQFTFLQGEDAWTDNLSASGTQLKWLPGATYLIEVRAEYKKSGDWNNYVINPANNTGQFRVGRP